MRILMAQHNYFLGDIEGNTQKILDCIGQYQAQVDVIVTPELAITGYPPEDLLLRPEFQRRVDKAIIELSKSVKDCHLVVGHPSLEDGQLYNSASVIHQGEIKAHYHKQKLPNYKVFDEKRYFEAGDKSCVFTHGNIRFAVTICEDLWHPDPLKQASDAGADCLLCLNASPFHSQKNDQRINALRKTQMNQAKIPIFYVNCVGGQDELVFDGQSMALNGDGELMHLASAFKEEAAIVTLSTNKSGQLEIKENHQPEALSYETMIYQALVMGTRDYIVKNGFKGALLGLSGGIDSALTLAIASDAIGSPTKT